MTENEMTDRPPVLDGRQIAARIRDALKQHGIHDCQCRYDDSGSLVSVHAEYRWGGDGECLVCIWADRVQKWQRNTPYNYTRGFAVGDAVYYATVEQMIAAVRTMMARPVAACWKGS